MSEETERAVRRVTFNLTPFGASGAEDFYANVTGVGNTPTEVVLAFGQLFPDAAVSASGVIEIPPRVRISLPSSAAEVLLRQLSQQLEQRRSMEEAMGAQEQADDRSSAQ